MQIKRNAILTLLIPLIVSSCAATAHDWFNRGEEAAVKRNYREAIEYYSRALETDTENVTFLNKRAQAFLAAKRYEEAVKDFNKIISLTPGNAAYRNSRGKALYESVTELFYTEHEEALKDARTIIVNLKDANTDFDRAIELDPGNADYLNNRGLLYSLMGQVLNKIGYQEEGEAAFAKARNDLRSAIGLEQGNPVFYHNLGRIHLRTGEFDLAETNLFKAWESSAGNTEILKSLVELLITQKKYDQADTFIKELIRLDPDNEEVYRNLAVIGISRNEYERAFRNLNQALSLAPESGIVRNDYGSFIKNHLNKLEPDLVLTETDKYFNAVSDQRALKLIIDVYSTVGNIYLEKKDYDKAMETFTKIAVKDNRNANAYFNLARIYSLRGDTENMYTFLNKALTIDSNLKAKALTVPEFSEYTEDTRFRQIVG